jgi:hypothetical protein
MRRPISPIRGHEERRREQRQRNGPDREAERAFWVSFGHPPPQESPACTAVALNSTAAIAAVANGSYTPPASDATRRAGSARRRPAGGRR